MLLEIESKFEKDRFTWTCHSNVSRFVILPALQAIKARPDFKNMHFHVFTYRRMPLFRTIRVLGSN